MQTEVAVPVAKEEKELISHYEKLPREIDPMVLAQPDFYFAPKAEKMRYINNYLDLIKEQDRTREAIRLLQQSTTDPATF